MKKLVLSILFMSLFSSTIFAASGTFDKIKDCVLYYHSAGGVKGIILLNNINEIITRSNGIQIVFGGNSTKLYSSKSETQQTINAILTCSK